MQMYLNEFRKSNLLKELPFLTGFIPRGISGMAEVFDLRLARHDKTVMYCAENEDGEMEEEEVSYYEAMKREIDDLYDYFNHDVIYAGIVDGIKITVFSEIEEGEWVETWEQFEQDFYKFYFVIEYAEVEKPIIAMEDHLTKQLKHFKPIILSHLRGGIDIQLSYHKNRLHIKGVDVWDVT